VEAAGHFLAVAGDEGNGRAFIEQPDCGCGLFGPGIDVGRDERGNAFDVCGHVVSTVDDRAATIGPIAPSCQSRKMAAKTGSTGKPSTVSPTARCREFLPPALFPDRRPGSRPNCRWRTRFNLDAKGSIVRSNHSTNEGGKPC